MAAGDLSPHEGATRAIAEDVARRYAEAYRVSFEWLWEGRGEGPAPDPARVEKFEVGAKHAERRRFADPLEVAFIRLRLARRLAGFRSVTDAARRLDLARSTVAAHESGQNRLSRAAADYYAGAYGVHATWLRSGIRPSGYPRGIEARLEELMSLYDESERVALKALPALPERFVPSTFLPARPPQAKSGVAAPPLGDTLPEIATRDLIEALSEGRIDLTSVPAKKKWWFPEGFLPHNLECDPAHAVVVVAGASSPGVHVGDRIIVDISARSPLPGGRYAAIDLDGIVYAGFPAEGHTVLGRACGRVGTIR
jgi:hypothetical protein